MKDNVYRTIPYRLANLNRLNSENPLTKTLEYFQMIKIIQNFRNKAPGKTGINKMILTKLPRVALERLNDMINILLSMGYFIVVYKNGLMVLTPKEGKDNREAINFCPITLLEIPGKVLERTLNDRFYNQLEDNNLINPNQYGFRKRYGTELAITKVYEKISLNQMMRGQCNVVCRDVSKAVNKVWPPGLKFKTLQLQLPDIFEKILCNFLDNRTAQIKMDNLSSKKFSLKSGVPQGSILSPTLYIFYTSDMPGPRHGGTGVMFADDVTQLVEYHHRSKNMLARRTEREIDRINTFKKKWKI